MKYELKRHIRIINKFVSFPKILSLLPNPLCEYSYYGKIYCPFHYNINTPSAKIFNDEGGDTLYCYSEQKLYRPADLVLQDIIPYSIEDIVGMISQQIDLSSITDEDLNLNGEKRIRYSNLYTEDFKLKKISLKQYLEKIRELYGET